MSMDRAIGLLVFVIVLLILIWVVLKLAGAV